MKKDKNYLWHILIISSLRHLRETYGVTEIRRHQVEKVRAFLPFSIIYISSNPSEFAKIFHAQHRHIIATGLLAFVFHVNT